MGAQDGREAQLVAPGPAPAGRTGFALSEMEVWLVVLCGQWKKLQLRCCWAESGTWALTGAKSRWERGARRGPCPWPPVTGGPHGLALQRPHLVIHTRTSARRPLLPAGRT